MEYAGTVGALGVAKRAAVVGIGFCFFSMIELAIVVSVARYIFVVSLFRYFVRSFVVCLFLFC